MVIDTSPFHEKLETLKSKMNQWIDNWPYSKGIIIDMNAVNQFSIAEAFRIYDQIGIFFVRNQAEAETLC